MVNRDLDLERQARVAHDSAAAAATPAEESTTERLDEELDHDSDGERGDDEVDVEGGSDPEADDDQLEACRLADSALEEQLAAVEDDALRLHRLEHGLDESGDVGLDSVDTSSPLRALAGLGAKSRGLGSNQLARLSDRLDKAVGAASTSTMTSPTLGCVLAAPGGNFASAPGAGGAFMGPGLSTHSTSAAGETDPRPAQHEHTAKPPAFRRENQQSSTPTRSGPRFGGVSAETTPGPRFGGAVATAMGSALRTAVSRVGDVVAPRASPSSDGSYENISQSPFVASGPPRSREALELRGAARMARSDSTLPTPPAAERPSAGGTAGWPTGVPNAPALRQPTHLSTGRFSSDLSQYEIKPQPRATFEDVSRAMGRLGGEPIDGPRHAVNRAMLNALNECGASSFEEAFEIFEAARPNWRAELASAPPQDDTVPQVMEVSADEIRSTLDRPRFGAHKAIVVTTPPPVGPTVMTSSNVHVRRDFSGSTSSIGYAGMDPAPGTGAAAEEWAVGERLAHAEARKAAAAERTAAAAEHTLAMQFEDRKIRMRRTLKEDATADTHDFKIMRMLINDCSWSSVPDIARATEPTAESKIITDQYFETIKARVAKATVRASKWGLLFRPTNKILSDTARCAFGKDGLHPDLFQVYSFDDTNSKSKAIAELDIKNSELEAVNSSTLSKDRETYKKRGEQMAAWIRHVLSASVADHLKVLIDQACHDLEFDRQGLVTLSNVKLAVLEALEGLHLALRDTLKAVKMACTESLDGLEVFPSLSRCRLAALADKADGSGDSVMPPSYLPLVAADVMSATGNVIYAPIYLATRIEQLENRVADRNRAERDEAEKSELKQIESLLCVASSKRADKPSKARAGGGAAAKAGGDADATAEAATKLTSAARGRSARRQFSKAKLAARAGRVWDPLDVMMCGGESQADSAGLLLGPAVRASTTRAGGSQLVGSQLMEPHEREVLRSDPACKLMAEGVELCLRNLSHDRCPHSHTDPAACKWHHLAKDALPASVATPAKLKALPKALQMYFIACGGCRVGEKFHVDKRADEMAKLRPISPFTGGRDGDATGGRDSSSVAPDLASVPGVVPPPPYLGVASSTHELEAPLKDLWLRQAKSLFEVDVPPPVKAHPWSPQDSPDRPELGALVARGEQLVNFAAGRVSSHDAKNEHFLVWTAKLMHSIQSDEECRVSSVVGTPVIRPVSDEDAFLLSMSVGVRRGLRSLSETCAQYEQVNPATAAVRAAGNRSPVTGRALMVVYPPDSSEIPKHRVEILDGVFCAFNAGSWLVDGEGTGRDDQCVLLTFAVLDLVHTGTVLTKALVDSRGTAVATAFTWQASTALDLLGPATTMMSTAESEFRGDIDDMLNWRQHDARMPTYFGRDLPEDLQFSSLPWEALRLIVVANEVVGSPMRIFVITGPDYDSATGWTAFSMLHNHHSEPMRPESRRWCGEAGASLFLRQALASGVCPTEVTARSWRHFATLTRGGFTAGSDVDAFGDPAMLRSVVGLRAATGQFYAGRSKHRWSTFAALEQRLPTSLSCFMRRFIRGGTSSPPRDLGGVAVVVDDPFLGDEGFNRGAEGRFADWVAVPGFPGARFPPARAGGGQGLDAVGAEEFTGASCLVVTTHGCMLGRSGAIWQDFGGDRNQGETPRETAFREMYEEMGITESHVEMVNETPIWVEHGVYRHAVFVVKFPDAQRSRSDWATGDEDFELEEWRADFTDFEGFFDAHMCQARGQLVHRRFKTREVFDLAQAAHIEMVRVTTEARREPTTDDEDTDDDAPDLTEASDTDSDSDDDDDDGDDTFWAGKSRERREAESIRHGPVVIPDRIESEDASLHRGLTYTDIMELSISPEEEALGFKLCDLAETEYDEEKVMTAGSDEERAFVRLYLDATVAGTELVLTSKSYRRAVAIFRKCWWSTHERSAIPQRMDEAAGLVDENLLTYIKRVADQGVDLRTGEPPAVNGLNVRCHQSIEEHATEVLIKVFEDFARCGAIMVSSEAEGFMTDVQCAPMSRVEKHDDEGFVTAEGRVCYDGRHGGDVSTNAKTPVTTHPPACSPTHMALIHYIVLLAVSFPLVDVVFCKRDVKAAFKHVWYSISDACWFGTKFSLAMFKAAGMPHVIEKWTCAYVLFLVLVFGWTESPSEYGCFGWAISQAHRSLGPQSRAQLTAVAFFNLVFVDDAAVVELDLFGRGAASCDAYDWSLSRILGKALNLKKLAVEGAMGRTHTIWGITYNLERLSEGIQFAWVQLSQSKYVKMKAFIKLPFMQSGVRIISMRDHQKLTGNVQWWSVCAPSLRPILGVFYAMTASTSKTWVAPPGSAEEVEMLWQEYDDTKALLRTLVLAAESSPDLFRSSLVDSLDFYDVVQIPRGVGVKVRFVGSDANGHETGGILSVVDYEAETWAFARISEYAPELLRRYGKVDSTMESDMIIFISELLAVIALAAQHGHLWSGAVVAALIDNDNANVAFGTRKSKSRYVRWLLLILTALEFRFKFRLVGYYVNTHSNWLLDGIGRYDIFEDLSDSDAQAELQKELIDRYLPGFTFEEMTTLLDFFAKGSSVEKSFALPDGSLDVGVELSQEPLNSCQVDPTDTNTLVSTAAALDDGRVGFGEVCAGSGAFSAAAERQNVPVLFFIELAFSRFRFLRVAHPSAERARDVMKCTPQLWEFKKKLPRIVSGGPPCVWAAEAGKQLGPERDSRADPFTSGAAEVVKRLGGVRTVWMVNLENVPSVTSVCDGEGFKQMLRGFYEQGYQLTPRLGTVSDPPSMLQTIQAAKLGGVSTRARVVPRLEPRWVIKLIGHAEPVVYPTNLLPVFIADILEAPENVDPALIMPGRFSPLSGTCPDDNGIVLAGYLEYGGADDPVIRGSLVKLAWSPDPWRVQRMRGSTLDLMRNDRRRPDKLDKVPMSEVRTHLRERRRVNHHSGKASTICKFGEAGLVGGPGHQLILRPCVGVTWFTARELWRLMGDAKLQDARYDEFQSQNPSASYDDLASVPGDAVAQCVADEVLRTNVHRCALIVNASKELVARWAQSQFRLKQPRGGETPLSK